MKAYVCDICGITIDEPHTARMREFCFSISNCDSYQVGAHIIDVPTKDKIKKKIHLCSNCFENLSNIARGNKALQDNLGDITDFQQIIDDTPTADVVEVVRCKDCKHWGGVTFGYICRRFSGSYIRNETRETDFCSYGEKR